MKITSTYEVDSQEWNDLVLSIGGGFFQCHAEVVYSSLCAGADPLYAQAWNEREECIGIVTGSVARSQVWPFSRFCNWAMLTSTPVARDDSLDSQRLILSALETHLRKQGVFSVRIDSYDSSHSEKILSSLGYDLVPRYEFYVDLRPPQEEIWAKFKGHRRTDIRKAEKLGVQVRRENTKEAFDLLMSFQAQSMRRRDVAVQRPSDSVVSVRRKQLENGMADIFVCYHEDTPVNASLFGVFNHRPYYHVSGASERGYQCCGPVYLLWKAIQHYKERNAHCLNLGAALEDQTGLYRFKQDFGAQAVSQPIGKKRISKIGSALHTLRRLLRR